MQQASGQVEVVIPVRNGAAFVRDAVLSAAGQSLPPRRIWVVDDGSRDRTASVVEALAGEAPVDLLRLPRSRGPAAARNLGIGRCTSEWVAFLDADDTWHPDKLRRQVACARESPFSAGLGLVYCRANYRDGEGIDLDAAYQPFVRPGLRGPVGHRLLSGNWITGSASAAMVRLDALRAVGLWREDLRYGEDWDLWLRLGRRYAFDWVEERLVTLRIHPGGAQRRVSYVLPHELHFFNTWGEALTDEAIRAFRQRLWHHLLHPRRHPWRILLAQRRLRRAIRLRVFPERRGQLWRLLAGSRG